MADKRITDVDFLDSLNGNESFFVNQNNTLKQVNKNNIVMTVTQGGTGATTASEALKNLGIIDWFKSGTSIPSNSNLDSYTTIGKYYVPNTEISETIINSPTTSGNYALYVFARTNNSVVTQLAISYNGAIYVRGINSQGEWKSWKKVLQLENSERALDISKGGTGATTVEDALTNLGAISKNSFAFDASTGTLNITL
jgi:hypothetical protein